MLKVVKSPNILSSRVVDPIMDNKTNHTPVNANPLKWSNTLKQFVDSLPTNRFSVSDYFVVLALKGIIIVTLQCYCHSLILLSMHPSSAVKQNTWYNFSIHLNVVVLCRE